MGTTDDLNTTELGSNPSVTEPILQLGGDSSANETTSPTIVDHPPNGTAISILQEPLTQAGKIRRNVSFTQRENDPIEPQIHEFEPHSELEYDEDGCLEFNADHKYEISDPEDKLKPEFDPTILHNHVTGTPVYKRETSRSSYGGSRTSLQKPKPKPKAPDGGWGWVILVATFFNYIIVAAIWHSFPVLYLAYSDHFRESLARAGIIASVEAAALHFTGAIGSGLVERYGSRPVAMVGSAIASISVFSGAFATSVNHLYVVYGVAGAGIGLSYVSFVVIVQQWFDKRRPIASGFSLTGFSVAVFCLPPITQYLLDHFGWRGCLILMSGVYLNGIVMAALLRPVPVPKIQPTQGRRTRTRSFSQNLRRQVSVEKVTSTTAKICRFCRQVFDFSMFKDIRFMLYGFGTFLMMIGHIAFITHIVSKAERYLGIEKHKAMLLPSIYGISNGVCRILFSLVASLPKVNRTVQYGVWIIIGGVICCLSCMCNTFTTLAVACSGFGMCVGSYISIQHPVLVDLLGVERIVRSAGLLQVFIGFAGLMATPFAGWVYDITGDYDIPYYIIGGLKILGGIVILLIPCLTKARGIEIIETSDADDVEAHRPRTISSASSYYSNTIDGGTERRSRTLSESSYPY